MPINTSHARIQQTKKKEKMSLDALAPRAPASKPVHKCFICKGTEFAQKGCSFTPIAQLDIKLPNDVALIKYFHPEKFSVTYSMGTFLIDVLQRRMKEEDSSLSFHVENSPNYDYVRKHYRPVDANARPCIFVAINPFDSADTYCVACLQTYFKKQEEARVDKILLQVVAQPELFAFPYNKKPYGNQNDHNRSENVRAHCRCCWHCSNLIEDNVMYVGSRVHEDAVLCMPCAHKYHYKLHTSK